MSFKENFSIDSKKNASQLSRVSGRRLRWSGVAAIALAACYAAPAMASYLTQPGTKNICRVASNAPKANNNLPDAGSSWTKAYRSLGKALDNYQSCREIWIKKGTYDTSDWHADDGITVRAGQRLLGGFEGGAIDRHRPGVPEDTVLDGDRYAYRTVTLKGDINQSTLFENLTISGGQADGKSEKYQKGGGVYCSGGATEACSPKFHWVKFRENEADLDGGAVYLESKKDVSPVFSRVWFLSNESGRNGGAIAINNNNQSNVAQIAFYYSHFYDNDANGNGGAIYTGSVTLRGSIQTNIVLSEFLRNSAKNGGAIYQRSGGAWIFATSATNHTTLQDSDFKQNQANFGFGIVEGNGNQSSIDITGSHTYTNYNAKPLHNITWSKDQSSTNWYD